MIHRLYVLKSKRLFSNKMFTTVLALLFLVKIHFITHINLDSWQVCSDNNSKLLLGYT